MNRMKGETLENNNNNKQTNKQTKHNKHFFPFGAIKEAISNPILKKT